MVVCIAASGVVLPSARHPRGQEGSPESSEVIATPLRLPRFPHRTVMPAPKIESSRVKSHHLGSPSRMRRHWAICARMSGSQAGGMTLR